MTRFGRSRGFTLVELMIAMAILAVVISGAMAIVVGLNASSTRVRKIGDAQIGARAALDLLAMDVRAAGSGAASGAIGIAPGGAGATARRIPAIYSGPNVTITEPGGQTVVTNSVFIVSADPSWGTIGNDATGMQGVVVAASAGQPLAIACSDVNGNAVDCAGTPANPGLLASPLPPLLVGDFRDFVYLVPTSVGSLANNPPYGRTQQLTYKEEAAAAYSPSPKAPFGFLPGAVVTRARVAHWYVRQTNGGAPQLVRSFPTLTPNALGPACDPNNDTPFIDETKIIDPKARLERSSRRRPSTACRSGTSSTRRPRAPCRRLPSFPRSRCATSRCPRPSARCACRSSRGRTRGITTAAPRRSA
jgi:prepilin-type N-terminal cleavage/methylation domain-containing protein